MFKNVGKKLMGAAKIIAGIIIAIYVIVALVAFFTGAMTGVAGGIWGLIQAIIILLLGCLLAWLSGVGMYAFGQMADDVHAIREKIVGDQPQQPDWNQPAPQYYQPIPPQNSANSQDPTNNL